MRWFSRAVSVLDRVASAISSSSRIYGRVGVRGEHTARAAERLSARTVRTVKERASRQAGRGCIAASGQAARNRGSAATAVGGASLGAPPRRALAAAHAGQCLDRGPGSSGDLGDLSVLGLDIGLGEQVSFDIAEFRARYFTVRAARPVLVEDIEENELLDAAKGGASGHASIPGMLVGPPPIATQPAAAKRNGTRRSRSVSHKA